jgi:hypothetical protein
VFRTAAVSYSNGTIYAVARVEGSPSYKSMMQYLVDDAIVNHRVEDDDSDTILELAAQDAPPHHRRGGPMEYFQRILSAGRNVVFREQTEIAPYSPLQEMIRVLGVATKVYLESTHVPRARIAVPYHPGKGSLFDKIFRGALAHGGLEVDVEAMFFAGRGAIEYDRLTTPTPTGSATAVLSIDYDDQAFVAAVAVIDPEGSFREIHTEQSFALGHAHYIPGNTSHWREIHERLERIVQLPIAKNYWDEKPRISQITMLGDRAGDRTFLKTVRDAVDGYVDPEVVEALTAREEGFDPVFSAAKGMASRVWGVSAATSQELHGEHEQTESPKKSVMGEACRLWHGLKRYVSKMLDDDDHMLEGSTEMVPGKEDKSNPIMMST